jgi:hypothetical protein
MKVIAHRGNIGGKDPKIENHPDQILLCFEKGYDCEIDVWYIDGRLFLGHDMPQYEIKLEFIIDNVNKLWCHCKHLESLQYLIGFNNINCFYHNTDDYILTSHNYIWTYPGKPMPYKNGVCVMPEWNKDIKYDKDGIVGICTDYPDQVRDFLK